MTKNSIKRLEKIRKRVLSSFDYDDLLYIKNYKHRYWKKALFEAFWLDVFMFMIMQLDKME